MSNIRRQQFLIIGAIVVLLGFLLTRDVKGLVKPSDTEKEQAPGSALAAKEAGITIDQASVVAKNMVSQEVSMEMSALEEDFKSAAEADKSLIAAKMAKKWEAAGQPIPGALYFEIVAEKEKSLDTWVKSGNKLLAATESSQDSSTIKPALLQKANAAFKAALSIDSANIEAKTGLGITVVNGMGMPMDGIKLLLEVIEKDPKNVNALMQLGLFSIRSGQFDKAVTRFNQVVAIKKTSEAYIYLATALESLGRNEEAAAAYIQSKRIAANPALSKFVDKKVAELQNKN